MQGIIGVVGPTRMDYSSVAARLAYIADGISKMLKDTGPKQQLQLQKKTPAALMPRNLSDTENK